MVRRVTFVLFCVTVIFTLLVWAEIHYTGSRRYFFFIWNISLSWIPYLLSLLMLALKNRPWFMMLAGVGWFFFYPNAPYMLTDIVNLDWPYYYKTRQLEAERIRFWYDFSFVTIGVWTSYLLGALSLFYVQSTVERKFAKMSSWLFAIPMLLLSGYGIYLGRFIRLNSWDVVTRPIHLLEVVQSTLTQETLQLAALFGLVLICTYLPLYILMEGAKRRTS